MQAHCYRLMGSVQDAEDMVQETFLRAWRRRESFQGRASVRSWLYRIATNACLDALKRRPRRAVPCTHRTLSTLDDPIPPPVTEPVWLEPYPDELLLIDDNDPETYFSMREHITLAFIIALHLLPPRQRAILLLRDVLDWKAREVAVLLDTTVSAVKSALHRARATLAEHHRASGAEGEAVPMPDDASHTLLTSYVHAWETADINALLQLLKEEATFSMPPIPSWYRGREAIGGLTAKTVFSGQANGRWRLLPTRANRQIAFGLYRRSEGDRTFSGYGIQVLTFHRRLIADITTFRNPDLLPCFNLPLAFAAGDQQR